MITREEFLNLENKEKKVLTTIILLGLPSTPYVLQEILEKIDTEITVEVVKKIGRKLQKGNVVESDYFFAGNYHLFLHEMLILPYFKELASRIYAYLSTYSGRNFQFEDVRVSRWVLSVYLKDTAKYKETMIQMKKNGDDIEQLHFLVFCIFSILPYDWIENLPEEISISALSMFIPIHFNSLEIIPSNFKKLLEKNIESQGKSSYLARQQMANLYFLEGKLHKALEISQQDWNQGVSYALMLRGIHFFLQRKNDLAWKNFQQAISAYEKEYKSLEFEGFYGFFALLSLLLTNLPDKYEIFEKLLKKGNHIDNSFYDLNESLKLFICLQKEGKQYAQKVLATGTYVREQEFLEIMFSVALNAWIDNKHHKKNKKTIQEIYNVAVENGYTWVAANLYSFLTVKDQESNRKYKDILLLKNVYEAEEDWQTSIRLLTNIIDGNVTEQTSKRLVWYITPENNYCHFQLREQKILKNGDWNKGKEISLFHNNVAHLPHATYMDHKIMEEAVSSTHYASISMRRNFPWKKVLLAMAKHPYIFSQKNNKPVSIIVEKPELMVTKSKDSYYLQFPYDVPHDGIVCILEGDNKIRMVVFATKDIEIANVVEDGIKIPSNQEDVVKKLTKNMTTQMDVFSEIQGIGNIAILDAKTDTHVRLTRLEDYIYEVEFVTKPEPSSVMAFPPGQEGKMVPSLDENQQRCYLYRNLDKEIENAQKLREALLLEESENWKWQLDLERTLTTLHVLSQVSDIKVEWPQGKSIKIRKNISEKDIKLHVNRHNDWFGISGKVQIDENMVLDIKKLLPLIEKGNYIPLEQDTFLVLTNELSKQLWELKNYTYAKEGELSVPNALLPLVNDVLDNFDEVKYHEDWTNRIEYVQKVKMQEVSVPKAFKTELRKYQKEGFDWLSMMQQLNVGVCLADEMGLGKTVQALALLLCKASEGPSLVIAPTSVCFNWEMEANKFAPALKAIVFDTSSNNDSLKNLRSFDVLITSYGILQNRSEHFTQVSWNIVVLDEAQAVKNVQAKRTQAVMTLQTNFRMITTGTPLENNLSELWTLFHFINPGLLGSFDRFKKNYIIPIEKNKCVHTLQHLQKIANSFILRRTKKEVLKELPDKIEKTMYLRMSQEEASFYEAIRQRSLDNLSQLSDKKSAQRIQILAEITKLRRACCHPQMIIPSSKISSCKLDAFGEIISELINNDNKVLVFSQFVQHLKIIEGFVKNKKIPYQYLDGSTPQKERQKRVNDFQNGIGDVFLISLKAGGFGLNLTRASAVIHLDPWWNPAVEDQATDRAHRIGQDSVVTVYRLVIKNTIEQKILALHEEKRDLANKILDGTGDPKATLDISALLGLLHEE